MPVLLHNYLKSSKPETFLSRVKDSAEFLQILKDLKLSKKLSVVDFVEYKGGFRGFNYFEAYTNEQISACETLIKYLSEKYSIQVNYNEDMWNVSSNALKGESGIWSHVSYRSDKSDCHPQTTLIEMIKNLK